jgi:hypothetical protein
VRLAVPGPRRGGLLGADESLFAALLAGPEPDRTLRPDPDLLPVLRLDPPPDAWPDPAEYAAEEE